MHVWLGDVFDDNWDVIVPTANRLVVRCRQESSVVIDESDRIDGSQMLVVCLRNLLLPHVVLNDLLVLHTCKEDVLLVGLGVELDHIRYFAVAKGHDTLARLGIPQLDMTIVRG